MLYYPALNGEFVSDDYPYIVDNLAVRDVTDLVGLWRAFTTRFLVMVSFALNYHVGRLNPFGYHVVNVIIHALNAWLVMLLTRLTFRMPALKDNPLSTRAESVAFYAGLIFLCHPIQTQAVAYITQRATSLATLFYILSLLCYGQARITSRPGFWICSWIAMLSGVFCKEMIVTLPAAALAYEYFFIGGLRKDWRARLKMLVPYVALSGLVLVIFLVEQPGSVLGLKGQLGSGRFDGRYFLTEVNVLRTYLRLLFVPVHQIHHYAYPMAKSFFDPATVVSFLLLAGVGWMAAHFRRRERLISFTLTWFFITTAVEFWVVCFVRRGVLYEHWLYLPMVGFALFLSCILHRLIPRLSVAKSMLILMALALSLLTIRRNHVWQTEVGFWEDVVRKAADTPLVYLGSGTAYHRRGQLGQAFFHYQRGLDLFYKKKKQLRDVDRMYLGSLYNNLGLLYEQRGLREQALRAYQQAYKQDPYNPNPLRNLTNICLATGRYQQALFLLNQERKLRPHDPEIYYGLGLASLGLGHKDKAKVFLTRAENLYRQYGYADRAQKMRTILTRIPAEDNP